jgi:hypothetical protein
VFDGRARAVPVPRTEGAVPVVVHGVSFTDAHAPESLLPRYIVLTDQRVLVLARVEQAAGGPGAEAERAYAIKSNHHISELAKLGYSKKKPSRVSLYYRRSAPAAPTTTAAPPAADTDDGAAAGAAAGGAPATEHDVGAADEAAAGGDAFVLSLVQRVYHLESAPQADELKSRLQAAIARLMAL